MTPMIDDDDSFTKVLENCRKQNTGKKRKGEEV
jgi:hypothetical protein